MLLGAGMFQMPMRKWKWEDGEVEGEEEAGGVEK